MDSSLENIDYLSDIRDMFSVFPDPLGIIAQLIDLGKKEHNLNEQDKTNDNIINGCTSKAWMKISKTSKNNYTITTDSDSHIVSGLLLLLSS